MRGEGGVRHLAILFDLVQGIMLASQGKVLSPGNEASMALIVYVSIFPHLCFICVHMPISGLPLWCTSLYMPTAVSPYSPRSIASLTFVEGSLYGDPKAMRWEQGVCFAIFHIFMCPLGK